MVTSHLHIRMYSALQCSWNQKYSINKENQIHINVNSGSKNPGDMKVVIKNIYIYEIGVILMLSQFGNCLRWQDNMKIFTSNHGVT